MKPSTFGPRAVSALALLCGGLLRVHASDAGWITDWEAAKKAAAEQKKDLLIDFTGSDWCSWCKKLDKEVFSEPAFKEEAGKKFIFVALDFPQFKKQSEAEKKQNEKLQADFAVEGYPSIFLADAQGRPYARTGYQEGGAETYLKHLADISSARPARDKALNAAAKADGVEKAAYLKAALDALPEELRSIPAYAGIVKQVRDLDTQDSLGFRKAASDREASQKLGKELEELAEAGKRDQIVKRVDSFLATHPLEGNAKQTVLMLKLMSCGREDTEAALTLLDEVIAVDAKSEAGRQAQAVKKSFALARDRAKARAAAKKADQPK